MKHLMLDIYGVKSDTTDANKINEAVNEIITELSLKAVMPTVNIPYYYCEPKEDGGVSSFCLLDNGHITLHTFPFYGNCYIDIMFEDIVKDKVKPLISKLFKPEKIDMWLFDRDNEKCSADYDSENGFGPHLLVCATPEKEYRMIDIYDALQTLPESIGMHAITRPTVVTNRAHNYSTISGIIIIAESHISFHRNINTGKIYFDIYSCKFFDPEILFSAVKKLFGENCSCQLISRGKKQDNVIRTGYSLSDNGWRNNI